MQRQSHITRAAESNEVLVFDRDSVRAVDRAAMEDYGIPGILLMENAARGLAEQAMKMLSPAGPRPRVLIVCGSGNNGGDGYALARHVHNRGVDVTITALGEPKVESDAGINRAICRRMNLDERSFSEVSRESHSSGFNLIVDAIFGTGLDRAVTGQAAVANRWMNSSGTPVLAADVPSGMDCDTGQPLGVCVKATATVTFVGWKTGFLQPQARELLGQVIVADIGAPRELIERLGRRVEHATSTRGEPRR